MGIVLGKATRTMYDELQCCACMLSAVHDGQRETRHRASSVEQILKVEDNMSFVYFKP